MGEGNFVTQSFLLLVEDVNDNEPIFKPYPSAITVKENAPPSIIATVEATDLDEGAYGQVCMGAPHYVLMLTFRLFYYVIFKHFYIAGTSI